MQHHPRNYQTKALFVEKNILFHYWQLVNGVSMSAPGKHPSPALLPIAVILYHRLQISNLHLPLPAQSPSRLHLFL